MTVNGTPCAEAFRRSATSRSSARFCGYCVISTSRTRICGNSVCSFSKNASSALQCGQVMLWKSVSVACVVSSTVLARAGWGAAAGNNKNPSTSASKILFIISLCCYFFGTPRVYSFSPDCLGSKKTIHFFQHLLRAFNETGGRMGGKSFETMEPPSYQQRRDSLVLRLKQIPDGVGNEHAVLGPRPVFIQHHLNFFNFTHMHIRAQYLLEMMMQVVQLQVGVHRTIDRRSYHDQCVLFCQRGQRFFDAGNDGKLEQQRRVDAKPLIFRGVPVTFSIFPVHFFDRVVDIAHKHIAILFTIQAEPQLLSDAQRHFKGIDNHAVEIEHHDFSLYHRLSVYVGTSLLD